ncbi:MAG: geranylgeranyl reductase family protein [Gemmobacter sp.]
MDRADLIVAGSGPAGSAAALVAARAGLSVLIVDRSVFPRDKLCGGGISGRAIRHLGRLPMAPLPETLFRTCDRVLFSDAGRRLGEVADAPPFRMTMRRDFDAALHAAALGAGARAMTGVAIRAAAEDGALTLADGRALSAPLVIAADGCNSAVARALFGRAFDPERVGFGLEIEAPDGPQVMEIDLSAAAWGYGWTFPKRDGVTLGVGGLARCNADMKRRLAAFLSARGIDPDRHRCKGAFLPFGEVRRDPGRGRVLLAGDAAGLVDPVTGEGIAWALESGRLAAEAAISALRAGRPEVALPDYRRALAPVQAEIERARRLRSLVYAGPLRGRFLSMLAARPRLQRAYLALVAGERDYADIGAASMLRMGARLAGLAR